jgi:hypothetical protein
MSQSSFSNRANAGMLSNDISSSLPWPICTIDFEASSLDVGNFPIEVGLAMWRAPDEPIYCWSTLLRPTDEWQRTGHWSKASQAVHGIKQDDLRLGVSPRYAALVLNHVLRPTGVVFCDGGAFDRHWAQMLFKAAKMAPAFGLGDFETLESYLDAESAARIRAWTDGAEIAHRAGADAVGLLRGLAAALQVADVVICELAQIMPEIADQDALESSQTPLAD